MQEKEVIVEKLINYFEKQFEINEINCDFLSDKIKSFSIEPTASDPIVNECIDGSYCAQFTFAFASRVSYSMDKMDNILNNDFGQRIIKLIKKNNDNGILPEIDGIETIKVTSNPFAYQTSINTARYQINMKIIYWVGGQYE